MIRIQENAYRVNARIYNRERTRSSRNYRQEMVNKLDMLRDNNPQVYWKLRSLLKDNVQNENGCISLDEWFDYFKRLKADTSCTDNRMKILTNLCKLEQQTVFNELDFVICESEISTCIKNLKNKRLLLMT